MLGQGAFMYIVAKTTRFLQEIGVHSWYCWETLERVRLYKSDFVNLRL
jgi:hypothetical protein